MAGVSTRPSAEAAPVAEALEPASSMGGPEKSRLTVSVRPAGRGEALQQLWSKWEAAGQLENGLLPIGQVDTFLSEAALGSAGSSLDSIAGQDSSKGLTYEQLATLCTMLEPQSPAGPSPRVANGNGGTPKSAFKKILSKNRDYMESGYLVYDEAVLSYIRRLEDHRKKCEVEARYKEAQAASSRLVELKTAQVARMRQELLIVQTQELAEVHHAYEDETAQLELAWGEKARDYEKQFARAVEELKKDHKEKLEAFHQELLSKRPTKPKPSRDYLQSKKIEENLAKVRQYTRANAVRASAQQMYSSDLEQAQTAFDADVRLKIAKFIQKQQVEADALVQRGERGRNAMELKRATDSERRVYRFRNVVAELENLHKLEVVQLENFLDGQVQAGKAQPIKDGFQRRREQISKLWPV